MMKRTVVFIALVILVSGCKKPAGPKTTETAAFPAAARPVNELMPEAAAAEIQAGAKTHARIVAEKVVETPAPPPVRTHTIRKGDTLWSLAKDFYGSGRRWKEIAAANGIADESKLPVGKVLRIP
ncbi:MAG: LysM domain-containing protein [Planctomycetota bacterium]|nr:LysM domain-containing protein [Planctomycetota bacterium]